MLVLTRGKEQSIILDGKIRITVVGFKGTKVRIGIDALKEISVLRGELLDDKPRQGEEVFPKNKTTTRKERTKKQKAKRREDKRTSRISMAKSSVRNKRSRTPKTN